MSEQQPSAHAYPTGSDMKQHCWMRLRKHVPGERVDNDRGRTWHFFCRKCGRKCNHRTNWAGVSA